MKITVTGGTGFIGNHLVKYLDALGYKVDILSRNDFERKYLGERPSILIHCAWPRDKCLHDLNHLQFAVKSCEMFEYCRKEGVRVINIGTSSEYGVKFEPMREDMICEPITTYGIAKLAVTLFAKKLGFNTLRLFTVTGEGGKSWFDIKDKADKWAYPQDVRDTVDIELVCKAIERLIHAPHLFGEIINVGSGEGKRYGEVEMKSDKWMKFAQRQYEPRYWEADISKMKRLLNL